MQDWIGQTEDASLHCRGLLEVTRPLGPTWPLSSIPRALEAFRGGDGGGRHWVLETSLFVVLWLSWDGLGRAGICWDDFMRPFVGPLVIGVWWFRSLGLLSTVLETAGTCIHDVVWCFFGFYWGSLVVGWCPSHSHKASFSLGSLCGWSESWTVWRKSCTACEYGHIGTESELLLVDFCLETYMWHIGYHLACCSIRKPATIFFSGHFGTQQGKNTTGVRWQFSWCGARKGASKGLTSFFCSISKEPSNNLIIEWAPADIMLKVSPLMATYDSIIFFHPNLKADFFTSQKSQNIVI